MRRPLALGDDPMFDANSLAGEPVRPARDVAGSEDALDAGLEVLVDDKAAIDLEPRLFRQRDCRPDADPDDNEVGLKAFSAFQHHTLIVDPPSHLRSYSAWPRVMGGFSWVQTRGVGVVRWRRRRVGTRAPSTRLADIRGVDLLSFVFSRPRGAAKRAPWRFVTMEWE